MDGAPLWPSALCLRALLLLLSQHRESFAGADPALSLTAMVRSKYPATETRASNWNCSQYTPHRQPMHFRYRTKSSDSGRKWIPFPSQAPPPRRWDYTSQKTLRGGGDGRDAMADSLPLEVRGSERSFRLGSGTGPAFGVPSFGERLSDSSPGTSRQAGTSRPADPRT